METNEIDYKELARDARKELDNEFDRLNERAGRLKEYQALLDGMESLLAANRKLQEENEALRQQLEEERRLRAEIEMKLNEMSKLSAGVARKTAQDDLFKALRIYLNISKRKTLSKREAAKTVITEMLTSAKIDLPEDILELLDHLDDEQPDPKVVNVAGNYNDVHDNGEVKVNG